MITRTLYIFYPSARRFLADAGGELATGYYSVLDEPPMPSHYRVVLMFLLADGSSLAFSGKPVAEHEHLKVGLVATPTESEWSAFVSAAQTLAMSDTDSAQDPVVSRTKPMLGAKHRRAPAPERLGPEGVRRTPSFSRTDPQRSAGTQTMAAPASSTSASPSGQTPEHVARRELHFPSPADDHSGGPAASPEDSGYEPRIERDRESSLILDTPSMHAHLAEQSRSSYRGPTVEEEDSASDIAAMITGSSFGIGEGLNARPLTAPELDGVVSQFEISRSGEGSDTGILESEEGSSGRGETPLAFRIKDMSLVEKRRLARSGGRAARNLLIRESDRSVHIAVIQNPHITPDEVRAIARMLSVNPEVFSFIAGNAEWMRDRALAFDLAKNPKVPIELALRALSRLTADNLRFLAQGNARLPIVKAARQMLDRNG
ncbi:MAG: hypothetical protein KC609_25320 [Myxococcales bacterium]|nr:hypothetical protein [Myxococcales bacterium]